MSARELDALIIGAGPAGTAAALALSALGYRSALIEKQRFPRFRIGESLPPKVRPLLELLGVLPQVESAGFVRMAGTTTARGGAPERHLFSVDGQERGYQVDRARFDALLLDECRTRGVRVIDGRVDQLRSSGPRITGVVFSGHEAGGSSTLEAPLVLDASGGQRVIARRLGLTRRSADKTVAFYARWSEVITPRFGPAEDTLFEMLEDGWLWSVLLADGTRSVTVGVDVERLRDRSAERIYLDLVGRSQLMAGVLAKAKMIAEPRAHDATWYDARRYAGPGFLLLGDAGFFADPLTSQGVYKALAGGVAAASVVNTVAKDPSSEALALNYFDHSQQRFAVEYAELARSFYEHSGFDDHPFWGQRAHVGAALVGSRTRSSRADKERRRRAFAEQLRGAGGEGLGVRAAPALAVEARATTERGLIRPRPCFVDRREPVALAVIDVAPELEPEVLFSLLDGRPVARCFEAYAQQTGASVSSETARRLMEAMSRLAEEGLIELVVSV